MSKYVKDLLTKDLAGRLDGVEECVVADVIGMDAIATSDLRKRLRSKGIRLMVVKNSLARRAFEGKPLAPAFEGIDGTAAIMWGLDAASVARVSKWPSRGEQLSMLVGQLLGPGAQLAAQLKGPGGQLAAQIKTIADKEE